MPQNFKIIVVFKAKILILGIQFMYSYALLALVVVFSASKSTGIQDLLSSGPKKLNLSKITYFIEKEVPDQRHKFRNVRFV